MRDAPWGGPRVAERILNHSPTTSSPAAALLAPRGPERDSSLALKGPPQLASLPRFLLWKTGGIGIRYTTLHWRLRCRDVAKASQGWERTRISLPERSRLFSFLFCFFQFSGARGGKLQRQPGLHVEAPQQVASPGLSASCRGTVRSWKALLFSSTGLGAGKPKRFWPLETEGSQ